MESAKKIIVLIFRVWNCCNTIYCPDTLKTKWNQQLVICVLLSRLKKAFFFVTAKQLHLKEAETQQAFVHFLCSVADQMGKTPQLSFRVFYYIPYNFSMPSFKPTGLLLSADIKMIKLKDVTDDKCWPFSLAIYCIIYFYPGALGLKMLYQWERCSTVLWIDRTVHSRYFFLSASLQS